VQSHKEGRNYHECAEHWLTLQQSETVFCLVQFQGVKTGECPRAYFVRPSEIVQQLKVSRSGHGSTILYERYSYKKGLGAGTEDKLPDSWRATSNRIQDFFF
jgi:hypothetical protein